MTPRPRAVRDRRHPSPSPRSIVIAGIVTAIGIGYVGPVHGYLSQRQQLAEEQAHLSVLIAKRDALRRQIAALDRDDVLEARARELGMVRPGERSYLVREPEPSPREPGADPGGSPP